MLFRYALRRVSYTRLVYVARSVIVVVGVGKYHNSIASTSGGLVKYILRRLTRVGVVRESENLRVTGYWTIYHRRA